MESEDKIILSPKSLYAFSKHGWLVLLSIAGFILSYIIENTFLYGIVSIISIVFLLLFLFYLIKLYFTTWTITDNQIIYKRGIIATRSDYLELYRVNDYSSERTFIDVIIGTKTIYVSTTDRSHSLLAIYGIPNNIEVIAYLRKNVEQCKRQRNIYEIANN